MNRTICTMAIVALTATSALAARPTTTQVGPYAVETGIMQMGDTVTIRGKITQGAACEQLLIDVVLGNTAAKQHARASDAVDRYKPKFAARFSAETQVRAGGLSAFEWYIEDIVLRCVNDGVARRYTSNP